MKNRANLMFHIPRQSCLPYKFQHFNTGLGHSSGGF